MSRRKFSADQEFELAKARFDSKKRVHELISKGMSVGKHVASLALLIPIFRYLWMICDALAAADPSAIKSIAMILEVIVGALALMLGGAGMKIKWQRDELIRLRERVIRLEAASREKVLQ